MANKTECDEIGALHDSAKKVLEGKKYGTACFQEKISRTSDKAPDTWMKGCKKNQKDDIFSWATVYSNEGKIFMAHIEQTSPSGDWLLSSDHYYRGDGTLALIEARLNTFLGGSGDLEEGQSIVRRYYYDKAGKPIKVLQEIYHLNDKEKLARPSRKISEKELAKERAGGGKNMAFLPYNEMIVRPALTGLPFYGLIK